MSSDLRAFDGDAGVAAIDAALVRAGTGGLAGIELSRGAFDEQLLVSMTAYSRVVDELRDVTDAVRPSLPRTGSDHASPATVAEAWVPVEFRGLIDVPELPGSFGPALQVASSYDVLQQHEAIAAAIRFPLSSVPLPDPDGNALTGWRMSLTASADPDAPVWRRDPDIAFCVALFWSAAKYSTEHGTGIVYA